MLATLFKNANSLKKITLITKAILLTKSTSLKRNNLRIHSKPKLTKPVSFILFHLLFINHASADIAPGFPAELYSQFELYTDTNRADTLWFAPKLGTIASNQHNNSAYVRIARTSPTNEFLTNVKIEAVVSSLPGLQDMVNLQKAAIPLGYRNLRPIKPTSSDFRLLAIGEELNLKQKLQCYPLIYGNIEFKQCFYMPFTTPWEAKKAGGFYLRQLEDTPMVARVAYLQTHLDASLGNMIDNTLSVADRWDAFLLLVHEWNYLSPTILRAEYEIDFTVLANMINTLLTKDDFLSEAMLQQLKQSILSCQCGIRFKQLSLENQEIALDYYLTREFFQTLYVSQKQIPSVDQQLVKVYIPSLGSQVQFALKGGAVELESNMISYTTEFTEQISSAGRPSSTVNSSVSRTGLETSENLNPAVSPSLRENYAIFNPFHEGPKGNRIQGRVFFDLHCISGNINSETDFKHQGNLWQLNNQTLTNNGYRWTKELSGCETKRYIHFGFNVNPIM
jgi:hypothetical protein